MAVSRESPPGGLPVRTFDEAIGKLDQIIAGYPAGKIPPRMREFYDVHLLTQAQMWRALLQCIRALRRPGNEPVRIAEAEEAIREFLTIRKRAAQGRWKNWYRGDKKVNTPNLLRLLQSTRTQLAGSG